MAYQRNIKDIPDFYLEILWTYSEAFFPECLYKVHKSGADLRVDDSDCSHIFYGQSGEILALDHKKQTCKGVVPKKLENTEGDVPATLEMTPLTGKSAVKTSLKSKKKETIGFGKWKAKVFCVDGWLQIEPDVDSKEETKTNKGALWLSQGFPRSMIELFPVFETLAQVKTEFKEWNKLYSLAMPAPGFPVKFEFPVTASVNACVTFLTYKEKEIASSFFHVPSAYKLANSSEKFIISRETKQESSHVAVYATPGGNVAGLTTASDPNNDILEGWVWCEASPSLFYSQTVFSSRMQRAKILNKATITGGGSLPILPNFDNIKNNRDSMRSFAALENTEKANFDYKKWWLITTGDTNSVNTIEPNEVEFNQNENENENENSGKNELQTTSKNSNNIRTNNDTTFFEKNEIQSTKCEVKNSNFGFGDTPLPVFQSASPFQNLKKLYLHYCEVDPPKANEIFKQLENMYLSSKGILQLAQPEYDMSELLNLQTAIKDIFPQYFKDK